MMHATFLWPWLILLCPFSAGGCSQEVIPGLELWGEAFGGVCDPTVHKGWGSCAADVLAGTDRPTLSLEPGCYQQRCIFQGLAPIVKTTDPFLRLCEGLERLLKSWRVVDWSRLGEVPEDELWYTNYFVLQQEYFEGPEILDCSSCLRSESFPRACCYCGKPCCATGQEMGRLDGERRDSGKAVTVDVIGTVNEEGSVDEVVPVDEKLG